MNEIIKVEPDLTKCICCRVGKKFSTEYNRNFTNKETRRREKPGWNGRELQSVIDLNSHVYLCTKEKSEISFNPPDKNWKIRRYGEDEDARLLKSFTLRYSDIDDLKMLLSTYQKDYTISAITTPYYKKH